MSYIDEIHQAPNAVVYCGPNNGTELHIPGGVAVRLNAAAPNVLQFANRIGFTVSFEAYNNIFFGNGAQQNLNLNAISLNGASPWRSLDPDTMLTDGSDIQHAVICITSEGDPKIWHVTAWRPTPTKVVIIARLDDIRSTIDPTIEGVITEMHRITVNDGPVAYQTFNGRSYPISDGWIPQIAGHFLTGSLYQSHGAIFRFATNGLWELYADASGVSVCTHTLDIVFRRYPPAIIRRFGNFT